MLLWYLFFIVGYFDLDKVLCIFFFVYFFFGIFVDFKFVGVVVFEFGLVVIR